MNYFSLQEVDTLFTLWQIYLLSTEPDYLHAKNYYQYLRSKEQLDSMLYEFDTTGTYTYTSSKRLIDSIFNFKK